MLSFPINILLLVSTVVIIKSISNLFSHYKMKTCQTHFYLFDNYRIPCLILSVAPFIFWMRTKQLHNDAKAIHIHNNSLYILIVFNSTLNYTFSCIVISYSTADRRFYFISMNVPWGSL